MFLRSSLINCKLASMIARSSDTNYWSALSRSLSCLVAKETKLKSTTIAKNRELLPLCAIYLFNCCSAPIKNGFLVYDSTGPPFLVAHVNVPKEKFLNAPFSIWVLQDDQHIGTCGNILPHEILLLLGLSETKTHQLLQGPWPAVLQSIFTVPGHKGLTAILDSMDGAVQAPMQEFQQYTGSIMVSAMQVAMILNQSTTSPPHI
jgi:hypothetical protein